MLLEFCIRYNCGSSTILFHSILSIMFHCLWYDSICHCREYILSYSWGQNGDPWVKIVTKWLLQFHSATLLHDPNWTFPGYALEELNFWALYSFHLASSSSTWLFPILLLCERLSHFPYPYPISLSVRMIMESPLLIASIKAVLIDSLCCSFVTSQTTVAFPGHHWGWLRWTLRIV